MLNTHCGRFDVVLGITSEHVGKNDGAPIMERRTDAGHSGSGMKQMAH